MAKIVPPIHFGLVEDGMLSVIAMLIFADTLGSGFYRSAQPSELNFSFLEKLNLRTVIYVGAEEPSEILFVITSPYPIVMLRFDISDGPSWILKESYYTTSPLKSPSTRTSHHHTPTAVSYPSPANVRLPPPSHLLTKLICVRRPPPTPPTPTRTTNHPSPHTPPTTIHLPNLSML